MEGEGRRKEERKRSSQNFFRTHSAVGVGNMKLAKEGGCINGRYIEANHCETCGFYLYNIFDRCDGTSYL